MHPVQPERHPPIVWLLIGGTGFVVLARAMSMPFLAIYLHRRMGLDAAQIGLFIGSGALAGTLGGLFGGYLSDAFGRRSVLLACLAASCLLFAGMYFASSPTEMFVMYLALSVAAAFYEPVSKAMISDQLAPQQRLRAFARRYVALNMGFALGPPIGAWLGLLESPAAFLVAAAVYGPFLVLVALATRGLPDVAARHAHQVAHEPRGRWASVVGDHRLLLLTLASMLTIAVHGEMSVTFSQYLAAEFTQGVTMFAWLMSVNAVTVVASQWLLSRIGERYGPMRALVLGAGLLAAGAVGFAHAPGMTALVLAMVVFTWGEVLLVPAEYAVLDGITPEAMRGTYYGVHSISNVGNLLGPWIGGLVLLHHGGVALFYSMAAVALFSVSLFFVGVRMAAPASARLQEGSAP